MTNFKKQKNILFRRMLFLLTLMLVGGIGVSAKTLNATFGTPAGQGHWDSSTNTYSWTQSYSNLMPVFTFNNGELAQYESIHLNFTWNGGVSYSNHFRLVFQDASGNILNANGVEARIVFGSAGDKTIVFSNHDKTKNLNLADVKTISIGGEAYDANNGTHSVIIDPASVYLTGPDASYTVTLDRANIPTGCDAWFTVGSDATKYTTSKSGVAVGTQVTFHASADNNTEKDVNGWRKTGTGWSSDGDPGWMGWGKTFTTTIRETATGSSGETWLEKDISITPEFKNCVSLILNVEGNGTAIVYATGDGNKVNLNGKKYSDNRKETVTFEATPATGYSFDGWYNSSGTKIATASTWSAGEQTFNSTTTYTAKFVRKTHAVTFSAPSAWGADPNKNTQSGTNTPMITAYNKTTSQNISTGAYVNEGDVIEFTAYQYSDNTEQSSGMVKKGRLVLDGWKINDGSLDKTNVSTSGIIWYDSKSKYEYTVNADVDVKAIYGLSYVCDQETAEHGSATLKIGETNTVNSDGTYAGFRANTTITATANPETGYEIDHWVAKLLDGTGSAAKTIENVGTTNEITFNAHDKGWEDGTGYDIRLTPVFKEKVTILTIGKPECNHYGSRINGENYFNIQNLNVGTGATIVDDGQAKKVTVGEDGGYVYFKFANTYNLYDLVKWKVTDNENVYNNVDMVAFYNKGDMKIECYRDAGNRTEVDSDVKEKLKAVDEIRIYFKKNTETTFDWIRFIFEHSGRTLPTLNNGTEADMSIYETTSLTLSNTPGFWRQYTDGNYNTIKTTADGSLIPNEGEWKSEYKLDNMQQGDYYFGARDGGNCALGYYHQTDLVTVHVNVKALDIIGDIVTTEESSDKKSGSYTDPDLALVYGKTIGEADVTINVNKTRNSFDTCKGVKLNKDWGTELIVNAPNGFRVQKVDITFGESTKYNVSMNRGNKILESEGSSISYTNLSEYDYVRMVVCDEATEEQKEVHVTNVKVYLVPVNAKIIDESRDITVEGVDRKYWLYVPENVKNGNNKNVAVVFALHGGGEDYEPTHNGQLNFNSLADANNFVVVYPRAAEHLFPHFNGNKARAWEATGYANNDTKLFEAIIEALKTNTDGFSIDEKKVYMAGFSVGGMMAYATANVLSKKFAAFASIAGLPMNEVHQRTHSDRPVPFLHVHGTKDDFVRYDHMPTIVDNMLTRNGLSYTPTATVEGDADIWSTSGKTRYKKFAYGNEEAGVENKTATPYIYYQIGTGMTAGDTGMGHNHWCNIGGKDVKQVMWEFFKGRTVPASIPNNQVEFKADINTNTDANNAIARQHGWLTNTSTGILAQYGESGGYTRTNQNVYHSIQLKPGKHFISFDVTGSNSENYVRVRVAKLADITGFNTLTEDPNKEATVEINEKVFVDNAAYKVGSGKISVEFNTTEPTGEYIISITKGGQYDDTKISNIQIDNFGPAAGDPYTGAISTDFTGYFNYNNRLFAQWNFDLSDGYRTNALKLAANPSTWVADYSNTNTGNSSATNGTIIFKNKNSIGTPGATATDLSNYGELTYDGSLPIAIAAGLKFMANSEEVKILVDLVNGQVSGAHLELAKGVKMHIPYVENSYRNDKNENVVKPTGDDANLGDFSNCMHHINRDIIYIAMKEGNVWQYIKNKCLNEGHTDQDLFRSGGEEFVNGKTYNKADYMGIQGTPCFVEFSKNGVIDRIGVNRNMIYSFYTEYINELGSPKPGTRFRVVGSPWGSRVADEGVYTKYEGAIAMTYGGWQNSEGGSTYTKANGDVTTDAWTDLGVINYEPDNSEIHFRTWGNMQPSQATTNSIAAIDGFPVVALLDTEARSGSLLPSSLAPQAGDKQTVNGVEYVKAKDENGQYILNDNNENVWLPNYTPACAGEYMVPTSKPYEPNITPWSLPSRGGYAKFEPSIPGVLNMNVIQNGGHDYYIADEFGNLVDQNTIFSITGSKQAIDKSNGCYKIANTDYVKHVLNVEPGKTYYIFSNTTGLGIAGFYFEPYVNHNNTERGRINIGVKSIKLKAGEAYSLPSSVTATETIYSPNAEGGNTSYTINYSKKAVEVDLRRAFKANQWETICLPYSMNQVQMEQAFGKGTRVVLLRDIQDKEHSVDNKVTLTLICHENQDIIAGYPYLIRPTEAAPNGVKTIASLPETAPDIVTVKSEGLNTNAYPEGGTYKYYGGIDQYTFKGQYGGSATVRNGSYVVKDGKLCKVQSDATTTISGYRAWVELNESVTEPKLAKTITRFVGADGEVDEEEATEIDIDQMLEQQGIFSNKATVYNVNGQVVRQNAANLNDLPKGIYIVNGKKYIVK